MINDDMSDSVVRGINVRKLLSTVNSRLPADLQGSMQTTLQHVAASRWPDVENDIVNLLIAVPTHHEDLWQALAMTLDAMGQSSRLTSVTNRVREVRALPPSQVSQLAAAVLQRVQRAKSEGNSSIELTLDEVYEIAKLRVSGYAQALGIEPDKHVEDVVGQLFQSANSPNAIAAVIGNEFAIEITVKRD